MAESKTPLVDLTKPDIGFSKAVWGNRWNDNANKIDAFFKDHHTMLSSSIQSGGAPADAVFTDYDAAGEPITPSRNLATDKSFRTMQALLFMADSFNDAPLTDFPELEDGAVVSQLWVRAFLDLAFPVGMVIAWAGLESEIPVKHWALCNGKVLPKPGGGTMPTPNLLKRFILGTGTTTAGVAPVTPFTPGEFAGMSNHIHRFTTDAFQLLSGNIPRLYVEPDARLATGSGSIVLRTTSGATAPKAEFNLPGLTGGPPAVGDATSGLGQTRSGDAAGNAIAHAHDGWTQGTSTVGQVATDAWPPYWALCYLMKYRRFQDDGKVPY